MKIPYNWLKELVPDLHLPAAEVAQLLTDHSFETVVSQRMANDVILEADVTPNRAHDCLCMLGIAREVAALLDLTVVEPSLASLPAAQENVTGFSLDIQDAKLTPRYMGLLLKNIGTTMTPLTMQARLLAMGARPISPIVDITNYVMFEMGYPTHAFAADKLAGKVMGVRTAKAGEQLTLLDGPQRELLAGTLVITNDDQPIALAGVMGGARSEVDEKTSEVFLEVANFQSFAIQTVAKVLNIRIEAAARFMKGLEPQRAGQAAARAAQLLQEVCGAMVEGVLDFYPNPSEPKPISFDPARVSAVAGVPIEPSQALDILKRLRCVVDGEHITPPADRLDLIGEHDLIEEVVRVVGLDKISANQAGAIFPAVLLPPEFAIWEQVRDSLVAEGFTETYNYSFGPTGELELVNPVSPEQKWLRTSLLPGLLANFVKNKAEFSRSVNKVNPALFEIGHVYMAKAEQQHLAVMMEGDEAAMRKVMEHMGIDVPIIQVQAKYPRPLVAFEVDLNALIGSMPAKESKLMTLEEIAASAEAPVQFTGLPKYPAVYRDISVLVGSDIIVETVQQLIERVGGDLVADTDLFDDYRPSADEKRGLGFHIRYQATDRTLTDEEVNAVHKKIEKALKSELDAQVR